MIPVNIQLSFVGAWCEGDAMIEQVVAELLDRVDVEPARVADGRDAEVAEREPVAAEQRRVRGRRRTRRRSRRR